MITKFIKITFICSITFLAYSMNQPKRAAQSLINTCINYLIKNKRIDETQKANIPEELKIEFNRWLKNNTKLLFKGILSIDIEMVKEAIRNGIDFTAKKYGETPLELAISSAILDSERIDTLTIVKLLLENGANANSKDRRGRTLLKKIFSNFLLNYELMKLLLEHNANVDEQDEKGNTFLLTALKYKDKKMVKILLEGGANPNITNCKGYTALMVAVRKYARDLKCDWDSDSSKDITETLLEAGADINIRNNIGMTALDYSTHDEITELFKKAANRNI